MYKFPDERHSRYSCLSTEKCKQRRKVVVCSSDMERNKFSFGLEAMFISVESILILQNLLRNRIHIFITSNFLLTNNYTFIIFAIN